jgi:hypothetical protein
MSVRIRGDYNQINYQKQIHIQNVLDDIQFNDADLEDAKPPRLESPPVAQVLLERLQQTRMLVLAGFDFKDKPLLARHLAWQLRERPVAGRGRGAVKEWNRPSKPLDPDEAVRKVKSDSIVLLSNAEPYQLGQDLRRLYEAVCDHQCYAIVTTDTARTDWGLQAGDPEEVLWHELKTEDVYGADYLASVLLLRLDEVKKKLPHNLLPAGLESGDSIVLQDLTVRELAGRLGTPHHIFTFAHVLCARQGEIERKDLENLLDQLQGDRHGVRHWYRQLDPRRQLLSLGLAIFDGLFDDQVFAALERLVNATWRPRNPSFAQFEYHELSSVATCFFGTERRPDTTRIETRSLLHRQVVLEAAWELHRRCLLDSLPVLTSLATESPPPISISKSLAAEEAQLSGWLPHSPERELFGSELRSEKLRQTLAATLSRIGAVSFEAAEPFLLRLAADPRRDLKEMVALALADWRNDREPLRENQLFDVLHRWRDEAALRGTVQGATGDQIDRFAHARATVALTVSLAAQHDGYNQMAPRLQKLFEKLVGDLHPVVRELFREETVPLVVASHLQQLEAFLRAEMVLQIDLLGALAKGIATACALQPRVALPLLDRWYKETRAEAPAPSAGDPSAREATLVTVILSYGNLDTTQLRDRLLPAKIFGRLRTVLAEENHPFVRRAVLWSAILQARRNFSKATSLLQDLAGEIALDERTALIHSLNAAYLEQREALAGGDSTVLIDGRRYPIWTRSLRPRTEVEEILYRWLADDRRPVAQQLAFESLASFLATEVDQRERKLAAHRESEFSAYVAGEALGGPRRSSLRPLSLLGFLAAYLATLRHRTFLPALRALLPELIHWWQSPGRSVSLLLLQKLRSGPETGLQKTSRLLATALELFRYRAAILTIIALLCYALFRAGDYLWNTWAQPLWHTWVH